MQDQTALDRLLQTNKPFTGLVIALGVNQNDGRAASRDEILSVNAFVRTLLRPEDFACRTSNDDFLLLCPGEQGVEAKQRLNQISERLWDFQLRGIGNFSLLFSWGDVQVDGELLSEAVASAFERMHQTRRARKTVSLDSVSSRKKVSVL
jgi:GGDEF domain-containing protein